jgi:hypothetical protein
MSRLESPLVARLSEHLLQVNFRHQRGINEQHAGLVARLLKRDTNLCNSSSILGSLTRIQLLQSLQRRERVDNTEIKTRFHSDTRKSPRFRYEPFPFIRPYLLQLLLAPAGIHAPLSKRLPHLLNAKIFNTTEIHGDWREGMKCPLRKLPASSACLSCLLCEFCYGLCCPSSIGVSFLSFGIRPYRSAGAGSLLSLLLFALEWHSSDEVASAN